MSVCKCGKRWETRDSTDEEYYYGMCTDCIEKARMNGEIPPKPKIEDTFYYQLKKFLESEIEKYNKIK